MKTSVKWLKDYIDFDCSMQELSDHIFPLQVLKLNLSKQSTRLDENIVVGEILST